MDVSAMLVANIHLRVPAGVGKKMFVFMLGGNAAYIGHMRIYTVCAHVKVNGWILGCTIAELTDWMSLGTWLA